MSTFGRPLTDDGLIRVLDHWLDDGPIVAPDLMVESALRTAARTPQRRWRGRLLRFTGGSPLVPVGLTLVAVAAVVALGAGLGGVLPLPGTEATPTPGLTDTPEPDATSLPAGWVVYTNEEDGYELTLPTALAATAQQPQDSGNPASGVRGFGVGEMSVYAVAISVGQPDGSITLCGVTGSKGYSGTNCDSVTVRSLDELEELLISTTDASLRDREYHADISLGGLPARVEAIRPGGILLGPLAFHHVYAIHDGRPIVVSFDQWTLRNHLDDSARGGILASFRLLQNDNPASGWVTYTNEEDGYELLLPESWAASARRIRSVDGGSVPGVTRIARDVWSMTISIGTPDGKVSVCHRAGPCQALVVESLDELDSAVVSSPRDSTGTVSVVLVNLGGEVGRLESPRATCTADLCTVLGSGVHYMWTPSAFPGTRTVVAIHDGRPVILEFEWSSSSRDEVEAMIASFRFLDAVETEEPTSAIEGDTRRVVTDVANGYAVEVPGAWEDRECCGPGGRTFYAGEATPVMIMVGSSDGIITICQSGDCAEFLATSTADLRHAVRAVAPIDAASWRHTLRHDPEILGGEPAEREWPDSIFGTGPEPIYDWVYAIHDGRPIVLRFNHFRGKLNPSEQQRIIESFDFLD